MTQERSFEFFEKKSPLSLTGMGMACSSPFKLSKCTFEPLTAVENLFAELKQSRISSILIHHFLEFYETKTFDS